MDFIFQPYPAHPWIAQWTFEPSGCNTAYRENCRDHFFRTCETVGRTAPHVDNPDWVLQVPVPQNSRINLLSNGFCAYFEQRRIRCAAEVLVPEPGVLWGRFEHIPDPVLLTDRPVDAADEGSWVDSELVSALLLVRDGIFCLVTRSLIRDDAARLAESYLQRDFNQAVRMEFERRAGAVALFEDMAHHDSLAVICVESMFKALRPPEGRIPHTWCQSSTVETPRFDLNEICPVALAWSLIDADTAEDLMICALKIQTSAGALPVHFSPHTTYSVLEAPKPLLAKTAETVWSKRKNPGFLDAVIPLLRRHLQWLLHHFDPKRRGIYSWKNRSEPIVQSQFQTELVTVDLAVLLLTEIEALNRLCRQSPRFAPQPPNFEDERGNLVQGITEVFWNGNEGSFSNALLKDVVVPLRGFPELVPLLWKELPGTQRATLLERIRESESVPGQQTVLSWHQSSLDDHAFPLLQQFVILQALQTADPHGSVLSDFSRLTLQSFVEWHTVSLESSNTLHINPATAAYIMNLQVLHKYRHHGKGAVTGRLFKVMRRVRADRTDLLVVVATVALLIGVHHLYEMWTAPPPLEVLVHRMTEAYAGRNTDDALKSCLIIIGNYPEEAALARLLAGNILILNGAYADAARLYAEVRKEYPDAPSAMVSLGLALQLQGRFAEAESSYAEFCYLFDEIFPDVVPGVDQFRALAQEGFSSPPKWQEIYRYQFMHEL